MHPISHVHQYPISEWYEWRATIKTITPPWSLQNHEHNYLSFIHRFCCFKSPFYMVKPISQPHDIKRRNFGYGKTCIVCSANEMAEEGHKIEDPRENSVQFLKDITYAIPGGQRPLWLKIHSGKPFFLKKCLWRCPVQDMLFAQLLCAPVASLTSRPRSHCIALRAVLQGLCWSKPCLICCWSVIPLTLCLTMLLGTCADPEDATVGLWTFWLDTFSGKFKNQPHL